MYCLIAAEAAIFTFFVVAYLFYVDKSLAGPKAKDVLHVPIFYTVCLLSSSITVHAAVRRLVAGNMVAFACFSRHDGTSRPVYGRALLFCGTAPARARRTAGDSLVVLALRGCGLGGG